jgi:uncharacterized protein YaaQ
MMLPKRGDNRLESPVNRLIIAIVPDFDLDRLLRTLASRGFRATRVASTGGYLRGGNSTLLLGVAAEDVADCVAVLINFCQDRQIRPANDPSPELTELYASGISYHTVGGGVAFIARVDRYEHY